MESRLSLQSVSRSYAAGKEMTGIDALGPVDLEVLSGEFCAIIGPSGCGKSTLLRLVAGLERQSSGEIRLDGGPVTGPSPRCGMVFQQFALFPWLSIRRNVGFGLPRGPASRSRVDELLHAVGLTDFADHYPRSLSGGMQQRAALARTLAGRPDLMLLDEPFGSLDQQTRTLMQELLEALWLRGRPTVLLVTHDIDEALFLADRVLVMSARPGRVLRSVAVPFPRPRETVIRTGQEFSRIKAEIAELLRLQVDRQIGMASGAPMP